MSIIVHLNLVVVALFCLPNSSFPHSVVMLGVEMCFGSSIGNSAVDQNL